MFIYLFNFVHGNMCVDGKGQTINKTHRSGKGDDDVTYTTLIWTTFSKETGSMHFQRKKVWYNRSTWTKKDVQEKKMTRKMEGKARE